AIGRAIVQTGAWVIEDTTPLPAELEAFLAAGEPPLFVGFGSMPATPEVARAWVEAARAAGRRVLVSRGWAELDVVDGAADALVIGDVAHDRLFPRVAAVVHHGGAGTTATAARAGVPQVIAPMFSDQPYWASRVVALGVGVATSQAATNLVDVLAEALDPETAATARALAEQVGNDGAATAARRLETLSGG
ncbi:MAG: hypothetical protein KDE20_28920, partial [Caldilineaceae bacterium]|nr:hypothetical protein [Caldilineaceae bacterium]